MGRPKGSKNKTKFVQDYQEKFQPKRYRIVCDRKTKDQLKAIEGVTVMEALRWDEEVDRWECYVEAVGEPPAAILKGVEAYDQWRNSSRGAKRTLHQGTREER